MFKDIIKISNQVHKRNKQKFSEQRSKSTPNFKIKKEERKTSAYYQRLYSLDNFQEKSNSEIKTKKTKHKKISLEKVFKKPNFPKPIFQFRKITDAKLPFTLKRTESKELIKERLKISRPSKLFHNFINIQWLRRKFPETVINKSIYTLLPNNGKPVVPENETEGEKRHRLMIAYLESLKGPTGKDQYIEINPKYFFNKQTWDSVLKLKKIFLDFDEDGNRRMELDEMQEMFNANKINASINDLVDLFFKGKKFKESEVMKLYLNFHQFINFALTKDKEFREFMRNIKRKIEKENKLKNQNNITKDNNEEDEEKGQYLPMTFKSLLDYFVDKGKQRTSKEIINKAIDEMNEIINMNNKKRSGENKHAKEKESRNSIHPDDIFNTQKSLNPMEKKMNLSSSTNQIFGLNKRRTFINQKTAMPERLRNIIKNMSKSTTKLLIENNLDAKELNFEEEESEMDYEKQLKEIDFNKLINEFTNLFSLSQIPKTKPKKHENVLSKIIQKNKKEISKDEEKEKVKNKQKMSIKILKKSVPPTLIQTVTTLTKDNTVNNKFNNKKLEKSATFYNVRQHKDKLTINDFKILDKNIKIPKSLPFNEINDKNQNKSNKYYKKIKFKNFNLINNSSGGNLPKFIEELNDNNKKIIKINDYMDKVKDKLPILNNNLFKYKDKALNNSVSYLKNRNKFIFSSSNSQFDRTKIDLRLQGGKINLFKKDINIKIPKSNTKLDYVPLGLLFDRKKMIESESKS